MKRKRENRKHTQYYTWQRTAPDTAPVNSLRNMRIFCFHAQYMHFSGIFRSASGSKQGLRKSKATPAYEENLLGRNRLGTGSLGLRLA
jgi:hypothetical protein